MAMDEDLEFSGMNPEETEAKVESGFTIPEGKYHAALSGAAPKVAREKGTEGWELEFEILAGPFKGRTVKDTLWTTPETKSRRAVFRHRLGLLKVEGAGKESRYVPVPGLTDFNEVLGHECIIDVIVEEYDSTKKPGTKGKANRLAFAGVIALDDPKVKDVARAVGSDTAGAAGTTTAAAGTAGATAAAKAPKKGFDVSQL